MESFKPLRFGAFEVDLGAGELRKHGLRLRLQEQPFQVLVALLQRPGEVVTREELVRLLWPEGTFVDFDRGLNAAVTRLRQALSDSAEAPRYVETVARRGYRFIAPVNSEAEIAAPPVIARNWSVWIWPAVASRGSCFRYLVEAARTCRRDRPEAHEDYRGHRGDLIA
jgi:DNA-binding winged helix-turn-helix (wHTH) protein